MFFPPRYLLQTCWRSWHKQYVHQMHRWNLGPLWQLLNHAQLEPAPNGSRTLDTGPLLIYWEVMLSMFRLVDRFSTMPSGSEPRKNSGQSCPCFSQETTVRCLKGKVPTQVSCYLPGTFWLSIQSYTLSLGKGITKSRETQRLDLSLAKGKRAKVQRDSSRRLWEKKKQSDLKPLQCDTR